MKALYNLSTPRNVYEQKIGQLNKRVAALTNAAVLAKETSDENQRLKQLLDFKNKLPQKSIAAEVIARNPSSWESFVIIDKGKQNGIDVNAAVAKSDGLIGRVFEAGEDTAKVMLIDSPGSRLGVTVQRTREQGILAGIGAGMCRITYLPYDTQAKPGDIIVTSELSGVCVKGMMIGRITKVAKGPASLYANAIVKPSSDLFRIEEVLCIE
ncbi:MAG: rod shape-determining protein MreC [Candidatus Omnitrophica bacterium]|nr:rod shape-determining protein MreC [Candidatus Omnitrophota bacterium]